MKNIVSIEFSFPGDVVPVTPFDSLTSVDGADIYVVASPQLTAFEDRLFEGKKVLDLDSAVLFHEYCEHWRDELFAAFESGKTVIVIVNDPLEFHFYTGETETKGSGKLAEKINIVDLTSNFAWFPFRKITFKAKRVESFLPVGREQCFRDYWRLFQKYSSARAYICGLPDESAKLATTKNASFDVAASITVSQAESPAGKVAKAGRLVMLPNLNFDHLKGPDGKWLSTALPVGKSLLQMFLSFERELSTSGLSPAPEWLDSKFDTAEERLLQEQLAPLARQMEILEQQRQDLQSKLLDASCHKRLLYANGKQLEQAVIAALEMMGFSAVNFDNGESEFDAVFISSEGRFIGEVEGKDNSPINVDKFSQLERNINEDFARKEVQEHAKGVLFANGYRLTIPSERKAQFTAKCEQSARRTQYALVSTADLYKVVCNIIAGADSAYCAECRSVIHSSIGLVRFPDWGKELNRNDKTEAE